MNYDVDSINSSNSELYYQRAKQLIKIENIDSLDFSHTILLRLHYFDSTKYPWQLYTSDFKNMERTSYRYHTKNIIGTWIFEYGSDSIGKIETSKTKKLKLVFTKTQLSIYENNILKRQTKYSIGNKDVLSYAKELFFQIYLSDTKEFWSIEFKSSRSDFHTKINFSEKNIGLYIYERIQHRGGWPKALYIKQK